VVNINFPEILNSLGVIPKKTDTVSSKRCYHSYCMVPRNVYRIDVVLLLATCYEIMSRRNMHHESHIEGIVLFFFS